MFKKTEESEWTRFSRALGGTSSPPATEDEQTAADQIEEPPTLAQMSAAETAVYTPPPAPPASPEQTYTPPPASASYDLPETAAPAPAPAPQPLSVNLSRPSSLSHDESVIGEGANVEGTVRSERSIRIVGSVQGEIESRQRVVVEETARVQARITAEHVTVLGEVNGSIDCTGRVEIASGARVIGEVTAGTLVIQEGAFFEGALKMTNNRDAGQ